MIMEIKNKILEEFKQHFNEPVLTDFGVARVVGYGEDEYDCYLLLQYPYTNERFNKKRGLVWHSAVGGYIWLNRLKGQDLFISSDGEEFDDLHRLDSMLSLNGAPKEKEFLNLEEKHNLEITDHI